METMENVATPDIFQGNPNFEMFNDSIRKYPSFPYEKKEYDIETESLVDEEKKASVDEVDNRGLTWGRVPAVVSSYIVDRHGQVLRPKGAKLKNYKKNPIVPYLHVTHNGWFGGGSIGDTVPVGKADINSFMINDNKVTVDILFNLTKDEDGYYLDPWAKYIFDKYYAGVMNAFSVGLNAIKITDEQELPKQKGVTILEWELIEISCVPVPANPEAVQKAFTSMPIDKKVEYLKHLVGALGDDDITRMEQYLQNERDNRGYAKKSLATGFDNTLASISFYAGQFKKHYSDTEKAGRVLSSKNEIKLRNAQKDIDAVKKNVDAVLESINKQPEEPKKTDPVEDIEKTEESMYEISKYIYEENNSDDFEIINYKQLK